MIFFGHIISLSMPAMKSTYLEHFSDNGFPPPPPPHAFTLEESQKGSFRGKVKEATFLYLTEYTHTCT